MLGNIWKAHDSSPWQNIFINEIQIHNQNPWFKPMAIHSSKTQFSLAILKLNSHRQYQSPTLIGNIKTQFLLATSNPNSHWQHQTPIFIGTTLSKRKESKIIKRLAKEKIYHVTVAKKGPWQSSYEETHWELSWGLCSHIINPWNTWTLFAT